MRFEEARDILLRHQDSLRSRGVKSLALFGSTARGEARPDSDVDVLVDLGPDHDLGLFAVADLRLYLQDILHRPADLALKSGLDRYLKDRILASARPIF